jgi:hypothetical protein
MTDRAVQPEAPTTKAGRVLLEQEAYNSRSFPLITVEAIVAIEAEARAASQERPQPVQPEAPTTEADALLRGWVEHHQPEGYEGIQDCSDINDRTEAYLARAASQERPQWRFTCTMDDGGKVCGRSFESNGCSIHAFAALHPGHRILVNGHNNRWCHDCEEWVDFDPARAASQERPQPVHDERCCWPNQFEGAPHRDCPGVAQERPPTDVAQLRQSLEDTGWYIEDDEGNELAYDVAADWLARLAGGSVASPEPSDG